MRDWRRCGEFGTLLMAVVRGGRRGGGEADMNLEQCNISFMDEKCTINFLTSFELTATDFEQVPVSSWAPAATDDLDSLSVADPVICVSGPFHWERSSIVGATEQMDSISFYAAARLEPTTCSSPFCLLGRYFAWTACRSLQYVASQHLQMNLTTLFQS